MQWAEAKRLARRSVEVAWHAGKTLTAIKRHIPHGQWETWLEGEDISPRTARRLMQLATIQNGQIGRFESIDEALKSLPRPEPKTAQADYLSAMDRARRNWRAALDNATKGTREHDKVVQSVPDGPIGGIRWAANEADEKVFLELFERAYGEHLRNGTLKVITPKP